MAEPRYQIARLSEIPTIARSGDRQWKPIRHHFGINAFGVNGFVAGSAGAELVDEHDELPGPEGGQRHQELYLVMSGHATFTVDGESIDAPAGTLLFLRDPSAVRSAKARDKGTVVLVVGAEPGVGYEVSAWEGRWLEKAP
jgi:hypothetical protein